MRIINFNRPLDAEEMKQMISLQKLIISIKEHIQLIQTYTDNELVLVQCNLILKEIEDE